MTAIQHNVSSFYFQKFFLILIPILLLVFHFNLSINLFIYNNFYLLIHLVLTKKLLLSAWLLHTILSLPYPFFVVWEFKSLNNWRIYFSFYLILNIVFIWLFFNTLLRCHYNKILTAWLLEIEIVLFLTLKIRRRHKVCFWIVLEIWLNLLILTLRSLILKCINRCLLLLRIQSFINELLKLIYRYMLKRSILPLCYKPIIYFFVSIRFSLLVGQVKWIAWLFVKCSKCICRLYERILKTWVVRLICLQSDHLLSILWLILILITAFIIWLIFLVYLSTNQCYFIPLYFILLRA
jgi:hypothetical protein